MNAEMLARMTSGKGFIAALDQSGGSTPKALKAYGIPEDAYNGEEEMFDMVHAMRTRIIKSPSFTNERILAAILFEMTMERKIDDKFTADYLWEEKGIIPILKIDKGLAPLENGVQLMKPIPGLEETLKHAVEDRHIFGTKERSNIMELNEAGIKAIVDQQFDLGLTVCKAGLVPILEPEVNINCPDKEAVEDCLKANIMEHLAALPDDVRLMFKLTIPTKAGLYTDVMNDPHVIRVVALSGGYTREKANELLARNPGLIASFSRAFMEGITAQDSDEEFDAKMKAAADSIYEASIT